MTTSWSLMRAIIIADASELGCTTSNSPAARPAAAPVATSEAAHAAEAARESSRRGVTREDEGAALRRAGRAAAARLLDARLELPNMAAAV
jgi:hypothetical protein